MKYNSVGPISRVILVFLFAGPSNILLFSSCNFTLVSQKLRKITKQKPTRLCPYPNYLKNIIGKRAL